MKFSTKVFLGIGFFASLALMLFRVIQFNNKSIEQKPASDIAITQTTNSINLIPWLEYAAFLYFGIVFIFVVIHIMKSEEFDKNKQILWMLFVIFFSPIAVPLYWSSHIRTLPTNTNETPIQ